MKDGEGSRDISNEEQIVLCVEVDVAAAKGRIADSSYMACLCVDCDELMVFAGGEELMASTVDGETAGAGAWSKLPRGCDFLRGSVDARDFA